MRDWPETEAEIVQDLGIVVTKDYDPDKRSTSTSYAQYYKISYLANGAVFEVDDKASGINKVGDKILIRYDPNDPMVRHKNYNAQSQWAKGVPQFLIAAALMVFCYVCYSFSNL